MVTRGPLFLFRSALSRMPSYPAAAAVSAVSLWTNAERSVFPSPRLFLAPASPPSLPLTNPLVYLLAHITISDNVT